MNSPNEICLPKTVFTKSVVEYKQRKPIRATKNAMKKV
jgi:hypothetical protein